MVKRAPDDLAGDGKHSSMSDVRRFASLLTRNGNADSPYESEAPFYGDLAKLNTEGIILRSTGPEVLRGLVSDFLGLLGTSAAVYESNGDYAIGIFSSGWCSLLDSASRRLCASDDNAAAIRSGKWLCHESCWSDACRAAIESGAAADVPCHGGLRLFAVPIVANAEVVGAINFGYGDPPRDRDALASIAEKYRVPVSELAAKADEYGNRPPFLVDLARKRLRTAATIIGFMVERFQARQVIAESEVRHRGLFTAMAEGFAVHEIICDESGKPVDYRFLDVNPAFEAMTGLKRDDLIGKTVKEVLSTTEDYWIERYGAVALTGEPAAFDAPSAGLGRHYRVHAYSPKRGQFAVVFSDITERVKLEEERLDMERRIMQAQKLESLGVMAGGIAHDFNNILMAILGHADMAIDGLPVSSPLHENLDAIIHASRRASELCRQMLAYAGKGQYEPGPVDLNHLIDDMLQLLKMSVSKNVVLNLKLARQIPAAHGDATQLRQILMNMVINASEAIGERSGMVTISTGAMECSAEYLRETMVATDVDPGLYVFFEVSDSGCGMSKEVQSRVFEPFFTTKFTGRGLGMSAVLGIVQAHRGAVKMYSEEDRGTTFKVLLAACEDPAAEASDQSPPRRDSEWRGSGTVLVVDDEETNVALAKKMLSMLGFEVMTAMDGREAVQIFRSHADTIRLVLMDLTMPHMAGDVAFAEMRRIDPAVPVLLASGYTESEVLARFAGKGLAGFVQKPFTKRDLARHLRKVLDELDPAG